MSSTATYSWTIYTARRFPLVRRNARTVVDECRAFGRAVADALVLHEHDPSLAASASEPVDIGDGLVSRDAYTSASVRRRNPAARRRSGTGRRPRLRSRNSFGQAVRVPDGHLRPLTVSRCEPRLPGGRVGCRTRRLPRQGPRRPGTVPVRLRAEHRRGRRSVGRTRGWTHPSSRLSHTATSMTRRRSQSPPLLSTRG